MGFIVHIMKKWTKLSFLASIWKKWKKTRNIKISSMAKAMTSKFGHLSFLSMSLKIDVIKDTKLRIHEGFHPNLHAGVGALLVHCKSSNKGLCLRYRVFWLQGRRKLWKSGGATSNPRSFEWEGFPVKIRGWDCRPTPRFCQEQKPWAPLLAYDQNHMV